MKTGAIDWRDLTVPNAEEVRDFYAAVVGWSYAEQSMGDYSDYSMLTPDGEGIAGICHARGVNAGIPPQWLLYINVASLDASLEECRRRGGEVLDGPREMGGRMAVIRDPAGAVCALWEPAPGE